MVINMTETITAKWGNPLTLTCTVKISDVAQDITGWTVVFTVKDNLSPSNDTNALIQVTGVVDADQVTNKGKFTVSITEEMNKILAKKYSADFKLWNDSDIPQNTSTVIYNLIDSIGKGDKPE